ncbi:18363_t:CDS:2, partial [Gigaspora rosea]
FVLFLGQDTWPSPMVKDRLKQHMKLLIANDILILPAFSFTELANDYNFPQTIDELIKLMDMILYNVSFGYDSNYQPNFVVKRGKDIPWCTERFDTFDKSKAICLLQMYFNGAEVWVVPEAFVIHYKYNQIYNHLEQQEFRIE